MKVIVKTKEYGEVTHICFNCSHLDVCVCSEGWFCSKDGHHIKNSTILLHGMDCKKFDEADE